MADIDLSKYIGLEFKEGGRDWSGVDCYGLMGLFLRTEFNILIDDCSDEYDSLDYSEPAVREQISGLLDGGMDDWQPVYEQQAYDGILLSIAGRPLHVGIVIDKRYMLHIEKGINACLERYDTAQWKSRIIGFYRHKNMAHDTSNHTT